MNNLTIRILVLNNPKEFQSNIYNNIEKLPVSVTYQYDFYTDVTIEKGKFDNYDLCIILEKEDNLEKDIELCKRCRNLTDRPLLVLGKSDAKMAVEFLKSGVDDYIRIPISKSAFEALLYAHYRREHRNCK